MSTPPINRRDFAKGLATGTIGPVLLTGAEATAQQQADRRKAEELLVRQIVEDHRDARITDEIVGEIFNDVRSNRSRGQRLSGFPLKNSDEPGFQFGAYRGQDE